MSPERIERARRRFVKQQQDAMDRMADCPDTGAELQALLRTLNVGRAERLRFPRHVDSQEASTNRRPAA